MEQITEEEKQRRIAKLGSYLNVAGERMKIIEEVTKTAKVDVVNGEIDVKIDKNKLSKINESKSIQPTPKKSLIETIASVGKSSNRDLKSVTSEQINLLLNGGVKAVHETIKKQNQEMFVSKPKEILNEQEETVKYEDSYERVKEQIISDLVNDKDIKNEVVETILYELFSKERIKKILKEILSERQVKKY